MMQMQQMHMMQMQQQQRGQQQQPSTPQQQPPMQQNGAASFQGGEGPTETPEDVKLEDIKLDDIKQDQPDQPGTNGEEQVANAPTEEVKVEALQEVPVPTVVDEV
jgi:hypothetical protein